MMGVQHKVREIAGFLLFFLTLPFMLAPAARGDEIVVRIAPRSQERIQKLTFSEKPPEFRVEETSERGPRIMVLLEGTFDRVDWNVLADTHPLPRNPNGRFRFWYPVYGPQSSVQLIAISPFGETQREKLVIETQGYSYRWASSNVKPKTLFFSPGLGVSVLGYRESGVPDVDQVALTAKASIVKAFTPLWDMGLSGYVTVAPLFSTSPDLARFLGVNARVGYTIPYFKPPWKVAVLAGAYFTTMFVSSGTFGFQNMAGPQLFPTARYSFSDGGSAWLYGKFSPVSDGPNLSFSNRELAIGGGYSFKPRSGRTYSLTIDIAQLALQITQGPDTVLITSNSFSVGVGAGF